MISSTYEQACKTWRFLQGGTKNNIRSRYLQGIIKIQHKTYGSYTDRYQATIFECQF